MQLWWTYAFSEYVNSFFQYLMFFLTNNNINLLEMIMKIPSVLCKA